MSFTHLQVRSGYSLMNSTITIEKLVKRASELNFTALALTDEHVLYGAIEFYKACIKHGIKPIIGLTVNVLKNNEAERCVLLAKDNDGYKQLMKISTYIQRKKQNQIEIEQLKQTDSLICLLGVTYGKLGGLLKNESEQEAKEYIEQWQALFTDGDFYLRIEDHGLSAERSLHQPLKSFSKTYDVPVVATNDVRYINEADYPAYDCLQAMKNGESWPNKTDKSLYQRRHIRSSVEMHELFADFFPEALQNTERIKRNCHVSFNFEQQLLPSYPIPGPDQAHEYLSKLCWKNAKKRYPHVTPEVTERLTYELKVIQSMGFSDYFLIVWDFVAYAKENDILVGPGRGSAAGSLIAYVLGITEVDPLKYNLLFERFLNPERVTMPDIDIDFSDHQRELVINYVRKKYGEDHVAQIITFGRFGIRSLLRELIKTMGIDENDARFILQQAPRHSGRSIAEFVNQSEDLKEYIKQSSRLKALFKIAIKLEGLPRHVSTHAAGVIISDDPLIEHVPLTIGSSETGITQYAMDDLEAIGLLKMDFLGLRNLTLLERMLTSISYSTNKQLSLNNFPINDKKTYQLLQGGHTNGVFQLESRGMKDVLTKLKPTSFEDIVAVNALFRPGPLKYIQTYIDRKHGREKVVYLHDDLIPILQSTYGVPIYQEQIMQIAHTFAGISLGEADVFRRAVSMEQASLNGEHEATFVRRCIDNGYNEEIAKQVYELIIEFSRYGFNRSHAVAYSKISYQLAYLKANYPADFFAELLSSITNQQEKVYNYIKEAKSLRLEVYPPSINKSIGKYKVENKGIRMGLLSIKGIGFQVVKEILRAKADQPFRDLFDFCLRVSSKQINRQQIELLIRAGAFDETHENRASLLASIDQAIDQGVLFKEFTDQPSLLQDKIQLTASYSKLEDFTDIKKLADEKELLGLYVSPHPLMKYRKRLTHSNYVTISKARQLIGKRHVKVIAIVQSVRSIRTKRGDLMAFVTLSDESADMDAVVFSNVYRRAKELLEKETIVEVQGKVEERNNQIQYVVNNLSVFDPTAYLKDERRLFIKVTEQRGEHALEVIQEVSAAYKGTTPIIVYYEEEKKTYQLTEDYSVHPSDACTQKLINYFGEENVVLVKESV